MTPAARLMAANWIQFARDIAKVGIDSPKQAAKIKARRDALFAASLTDGGLDKIQSSSKNGVSFSVQSGGDNSLSKREELSALQKACEWIDAGFVPSQTTGYGRF